MSHLVFLLFWKTWLYISHNCKCISWIQFLFENKNFHFALSPIGFKTQFSISSMSTLKHSKHKSTMSVSASKRPTHRRIAILLRCIVATLHKALSMLLIRYRSSGWSWKISNQFQEFQATRCNDSHQLSNFR